jgi:hypothetical protein
MPGTGGRIPFSTSGRQQPHSNRNGGGLQLHTNTRPTPQLDRDEAMRERREVEGGREREGEEKSREVSLCLLIHRLSLSPLLGRPHPPRPLSTLSQDIGLTLASLPLSLSPSLAFSLSLNHRLRRRLCESESESESVRGGKREMLTVAIFLVAARISGHQLSVRVTRTTWTSRQSLLLLSLSFDS